MIFIPYAPTSGAMYVKFMKYAIPYRRWVPNKQTHMMRAKLQVETLKIKRIHACSHSFIDINRMCHFFFFLKENKKVDWEYVNLFKTHKPLFSIN